MKKQAHIIPCPCGTTWSYGQCCALYHQERASPWLPEVLMRARFSAFVMQQWRFIKDTAALQASEGLSIRRLKQSSHALAWKRLHVLRCSLVEQDTMEAYVAFEAYFIQDKKKGVHHEISVFTRIDGRWYYTGTTVQWPTIAAR